MAAVLRFFLYDFVYTLSSLLVLIATYSLPVVSGRVGYQSIEWTWSDLADVGVVFGKDGPRYALYALIIALLADISSKLIKSMPFISKILRVGFVISALWFLLVTGTAVGENGPHAITGMYLYVALYGGSLLSRYMFREAFNAEKNAA